MQKIWKACKFLSNLGHDVIHYGHEKSQVSCSEHVDVIDNFILRKAYGAADYKSTPAAYNVNDIAFQTFDLNTEREILKRAKDGDFVLLSFPHRNLHNSLSGLEVYCVEAGIGYESIYSQYKVFESNAWMHYHRGRASKTREVIDRFPNLTEVHQNIIDPHNILHQNVPDWTSCVIPNSFDLSQFEYREEKDDYNPISRQDCPNEGA